MKPIQALRLRGPASAGNGFPVYVNNTATDLGGADATSHLVNMPATVNSGDLLIALIASDGTATITTPSGWTSLSQNTAGGVVRGAAFYKVASGTEGGTTVDFVTSASERMEAQVIRIAAGTFTGTPEAANATSSSTTTPDPPTLSPSTGNDGYLWIAAMMSDNTRTVSVYPYPSNNTRTANASFGTAFVTLASCTTESTSSSLDPGTFTINTASAVVSMTISVRSA